MRKTAMPLIVTLVIMVAAIATALDIRNITAKRSLDVIGLTFSDTELSAGRSLDNIVLTINDTDLSAERIMDTNGMALHNTDLTAGQILNANELKTNNTEFILENENAFDQWDLMAERRKGCSPTISCTHSGGYCVKSGKECVGKLDPRGCTGGKKCKCCLPDQTTPASCPSVTPCPTITMTTEDPTSTVTCSSCPSVTPCPTIAMTTQDPTSTVTCPSCPSVTPCPTIAMTTQDQITTTPPLTTTKHIPEGFEEFNGRIVRVPQSNDTKITFQQSLDLCTTMGAKPYIPHSGEEYDFMVRNKNGDTWLPASDIQTEGQLKWTDNTDAAGSTIIGWVNELDWNRETYDCVLMSGYVIMYYCTFNAYPMICEI